MEKYDYVVFGATGFTGKYVCKELLRKTNKARIALAGRTREKLQSVSEWLKLDGTIPITLDNKVGFILADVSDDASLVSMCKQARMVLDCVGPFKYWGEAVVTACIEGGCDYIDITGEPEYISRIMKKYHSAAVSKGLYILPACGFDCIPSELGMVFAKKKFRGTLTTAENFFTLKYGAKGVRLNFGTYASLVNSVSDVVSSRGAKLTNSNPKAPLPYYGPKLKLKKFQRYLGKYAVPFVGTDVAVVKGSQAYYYEKFQEIPVQFAMYTTVSLLQIFALAIFFGILGILTRFSWGVKLLLNHPALFSGGIFGKTGPSEEQMSSCGFKFVLYCRGYRDQIACAETEGRKHPDQPPDTEMTVTIHGPELAYVATPIAMVQAAICLTEERSNLPDSGGVFLPGPAFRDTTLIDRLNDNGITFQASI